MDLKDQLVRDATAFAEREGISLATLGDRVLNNSKFFDRLSGGASCTLASYERFYEHFRTRSFSPDKGEAA